MKKFNRLNTNISQEIINEYKLLDKKIKRQVPKDKILYKKYQDKIIQESSLSEKRWWKCIQNSHITTRAPLAQFIINNREINDILTQLEILHTIILKPPSPPTTSFINKFHEDISVAVKFWSTFGFHISHNQYANNLISPFDIDTLNLYISDLESDTAIYIDNVPADFIKATGLTSAIYY